MILIMNNNWTFLTPYKLHNKFVCPICENEVIIIHKGYYCRACNRRFRPMTNKENCKHQLMGSNFYCIFTFSSSINVPANSHNPALPVIMPACNRAIKFACNELLCNRDCNRIMRKFSWSFNRIKLQSDYDNVNLYNRKGEYKNDYI